MSVHNDTFIFKKGNRLHSFCKERKFNTICRVRVMTNLHHIIKELCVKPT